MAVVTGFEVLLIGGENDSRTALSNLLNHEAASRTQSLRKEAHVVVRLDLTGACCLWKRFGVMWSCASLGPARSTACSCYLSADASPVLSEVGLPGHAIHRRAAGRCPPLWEPLHWRCCRVRKSPPAAALAAVRHDLGGRFAGCGSGVRQPLDHHRDRGSRRDLLELDSLPDDVGAGAARLALVGTLIMSLLVIHAAGLAIWIWQSTASFALRLGQDQDSRSGRWAGNQGTGDRRSAKDGPSSPVRDN